MEIRTLRSFAEDFLGADLAGRSMMLRRAAQRSTPAAHRAFLRALAAEIKRLDTPSRPLGGPPFDPGRDFPWAEGPLERASHLGCLFAGLGISGAACAGAVWIVIHWLGIT